MSENSESHKAGSKGSVKAAGTAHSSSSAAPAGTAALAGSSCASGAQPGCKGGMAQPGGAGFMDELQHGVSREAQPLLTFLTENYRKILAGIGVVLVIVAGYGAYEYSSRSALASARTELGEILVNRDGQARLEALEVFAAKAPAAVRTSALFELARLSLEAGAYDRAGAAWDSLVTTAAGDAVFIARMGRAQAFAAAGKAEEAFAAMEAAEAAAPESFKNIALLQLAVAAEQVGRLDRAIAAYESLMTQGSDGDKEMFAHKIADLKARKG